MNCIKKSVSFVGGFLITLIAITFPAAMYSDYTARAYNTELVNVTSVPKLYISEGLTTKDPAELSSAIDAARKALAGLDSGQVATVSDRGAVILSSVKGDSVMVFKPSLSDVGIVEWRCIGGPAKDIPTTCRFIDPSKMGGRG